MVLVGGDALNSEFMKAGARGISLLYASGDEGANCKGGMFVPETPSSSPYVTAVGGTTKGSSYPTPGPDAEKAVGLSSGGFSSYWPMPSYQSDSGLVDAYLKSGSDIPRPPVATMSPAVPTRTSPRRRPTFA